jgi:hypothetical protein
VKKSKMNHVTFGRAWARCGAHFKSAGVRRSVVKLAYFVSPVAAERVSAVHSSRRRANLHQGQELKPNGLKFRNRGHISGVRCECGRHQHKQSHAKVVRALRASAFEFGVHHGKYNLSAQRSHSQERAGTKHGSSHLKHCSQCDGPATQSSGCSSAFSSSPKP